LIALFFEPFADDESILKLMRMLKEKLEVSRQSEEEREGSGGLRYRFGTVGSGRDWGLFVRKLSSLRSVIGRQG